MTAVPARAGDAPRKDAAERHDRFVAEAVRRLDKDKRVIGIIRHGSSASADVDENSDLDLTFVIRSQAERDLPGLQADVAELIGDLIVCRPVPLPREGRVLFCLYRPDFLRVEIGFKTLGALGGYPELPRLDWDGTGGEIEQELAMLDYAWTMLDADEVEARFWLCVEAATRWLARGEFLEVVDTLAILRKAFLGPMMWRRAGLPPKGLRRIESTIPELSAPLVETICDPDARSCRSALVRAIELYQDLRLDDPPRVPLDDVGGEMIRRLQCLG
jgi:predicted nucleotidyltransferase